MTSNAWQRIGLHLYRSNTGHATMLIINVLISKRLGSSRSILVISRESHPMSLILLNPNRSSIHIKTYVRSAYDLAGNPASEFILYYPLRSRQYRNSNNNNNTTHIDTVQWISFFATFGITSGIMPMACLHNARP